MTDEELKRLFAETRRHFDVVAERLDAKIDRVVESVAALDEKVDRRSDELEQRMERGFADTQAMIKFSHDELDRRIRALEQRHSTLEETVANLQSRLERLEASTH